MEKPSINWEEIAAQVAGEAVHQYNKMQKKMDMCRNTLQKSRRNNLVLSCAVVSLVIVCVVLLIAR